MHSRDSLLLKDGGFIPHAILPPGPLTCNEHTPAFTSRGASQEKMKAFKFIEFDKAPCKKSISNSRKVSNSEIIEVLVNKPMHRNSSPDRNDKKESRIGIDNQLSIPTVPKLSLIKPNSTSIYHLDHSN